MKKEFVPYELAVKLKELGFDEECFTCYCNHWKDLHPYLWQLNQPDYGEHWDLTSKIKAPLWQQVFDWLRENHNIDIVIFPKYKDLGKFYGGHIITSTINKSINSNCITYEEALENALIEGLKLIQ